MLHTKFCENKPTGSGEDFLVPESFHTKFGSEWHSRFCENLI